MDHSGYGVAREPFKTCTSMAPMTPGRKKAMNGALTPSNGKKPRLSPAGQTYAVGTRVEAKDFSGQWYPATVSEVDWEEREILIHFDKYEEWMPMDSQRVRPIKEPDASSLYPANLNVSRITGMNGSYIPEPKAVEKRFNVGDNVMATWTNNRKYPATIASQQPNDRYDVVFYDGFAKSVRGSKISKMKESDRAALSANMQVPPHVHPQAGSQLKNHLINGNLNSGINGNQSKVHPQSGQSHLEKQLLLPPNPPQHSAPLYSTYANGFMPMVENIGTKEQRRERKRKHNVKELFSTKRPRLSDKTSQSSSKVRMEKKSSSGTLSEASLTSPHMTSHMSIASSPSNTMRYESLPPPSVSHDGMDKLPSDSSETEIKKKRKKLKKKLGDSGMEAHELALPNGHEEDDCSIQWTNGEPEGEAAYVIESAEGLRKSIIVDDRRLPVGWSKHAIRRQGGTSAGKWDVFLVRPEDSSPVPSAQSPEASGLQSPSPVTGGQSLPVTGAHPPAPHSITPQASAHGLQRVKTLLPRRTPANTSPNRRIMSPPPPHAVTPQPVLPTASSVETWNKKSLSVGSDGYVCPKDGCGKRFRKENLLQMHIKHYHPEYTAFMGSTPNVADLAYARTVGESAAETPNRSKTGQSSSFMEKIEKISRMEAHRKAGVDVSSYGTEAPSSLEAKSPTLGQLLKKGPMRKDSIDGTTAAAQAAAAWMVETASDSAAKMSPLRDALKSSIPQGSNVDHSFREGNSRPVSRAAGLHMDCDQEAFSDQNGHLSPWKGGSTDGGVQASASSSPVTVQSPPSYFYSKKKKSRSPVEKLNLDHIKLEESKPPSPAMEHLRREELINCTCGFTEEDGLMIQCDLCLCWQHGLCNQIENIEDVPQKYVCQICTNPLRERKSRHFIHDQDWLKEGVLPSLSFTSKDPEKVQKREDILKRSHDLCALLLQTQKVIHSLRVKVHIAEQKDHPKLYLWANSWQTESMGCPTPPSSPALGMDLKQEQFGVVGKGKSLLQEALLNGSPHQQQQQHLHLLQSVDAPRVPQPEAPIDPGECRVKLLDHIEHYQSLIDARLSMLEQMIDDLEKEDPSLIDSKLSDAVLAAVQAPKGDADDGDQMEEDSSPDFLPQTKETVQMILRDLQNLRKISSLC